MIEQAVTGEERHMGMRASAIAALATIIGGTAPAHAQEADTFSGAYAGPELGAHEHHFYLQQRNLTANATRGRYYRAWGVGGGAFAGYDFALSSRLRLGGEAGVSIGGNNPVARFADGTFYTQHPRYGYRVTTRAGVVLNPRLLAYATLGYGGHQYRLEGTAKVADAHSWGSSFTIGGGLEYRASERVGLRFDFRHLDNQMSHFLIGIPVRF